MPSKKQDRERRTFSSNTGPIEVTVNTNPPAPLVREVDFAPAPETKKKPARPAAKKES